MSGYCSQHIVDIFMDNVTIQPIEQEYSRRVTDVFKVSFGNDGIIDYDKFLRLLTSISERDMVREYEIQAFKQI